MLIHKGTIPWGPIHIKNRILMIATIPPAVPLSKCLCSLSVWAAAFVVYHLLVILTQFFVTL